MMVLLCYDDVYPHYTTQLSKYLVKLETLYGKMTLSEC